MPVGTSSLRPRPADRPGSCQRSSTRSGRMARISRSKSPRSAARRRYHRLSVQAQRDAVGGRRRVPGGDRRGIGAWAAAIAAAHDDPPQISANAAGAALEHHLGMTCDPVPGSCKLLHRALRVRRGEGLDRLSHREERDFREPARRYRCGHHSLGPDRQGHEPEVQRDVGSGPRPVPRPLLRPTWPRPATGNRQPRCHFGVAADRGLLFLPIFDAVGSGWDDAGTDQRLRHDCRRRRIARGPVLLGLRSLQPRCGSCHGPTRSTKGGAAWRGDRGDRLDPLFDRRPHVGEHWSVHAGRWWRVRADRRRLSGQHFHAGFSRGDDDRCDANVRNGRGIGRSSSSARSSRRA